MLRMDSKPREKHLKSLSLYSSMETVVEEVENLGFQEVASATIVSEAKFWSKKVFKKSSQTITVSDEIGDASYLRDPVVTICGDSRTIDVLKDLD
jgi:reverse gyrase